MTEADMMKIAEKFRLPQTTLQILRNNGGIFRKNLVLSERNPGKWHEKVVAIRKYPAPE
jgi:hypothetical protein